MPKNHGPRGFNKKPAAATATKSTSSSNTNANESKKGKENKTMAPNKNSNTSTDGKAKQTPTDSAAPTEPPKKPDTRTLIGGPSWTGKLPVNMLNELCQKRKWDNPDYIVRGNAQRGFTCSVVLCKTDPKTREPITLDYVFELPLAHKDVATQLSAVEAKHFAATYTLFRLCNMTNMHTALPQRWRDYWKTIFQDLKKEDEAKGKGWMYASDPFLVKEEREKAQAAAKKKEEEAEKQRQKAAANPRPGGAPMPSNGFRKGGDPRGDHRGWQNAPTVQMGKKTRLEVERVVRKYANWNPHAGRSLWETMHPNNVYYFLREMEGLQFRRSHIEEGAKICRDREELIQWLLIHVPEEDAPRWSMPQNYSAGVSLASSDLPKEATIKRLAAAGYSTDLCEEVLDACGGNENKAASVLQSRLVLSTDDTQDVIAQLEASSFDEESEEAWKAEIRVLESTEGEKLKIVSADSFEIEFDPEGWNAGGTMTLHVRKPFGNYPNVLPTISLQASHPSYIRLSILKRALLHAQHNFLGDQMIWSIVDWITHNAEDIVENPGPLSDVSSASAAAESTGAPSKKTDRRNRPNPINWTRGTPGSERMYDDWAKRQQTPTQRQMLAKRQSLPAWRLQEAITAAVSNHQVTIISGETGSGKSTQSVQFILDDLIQQRFGEAANIICTQPRRISALGLADRVAEERCGQVGQEVGYHIRGESKLRWGVTKIAFMTTGILLQRLKTSGGTTEDVVASLANVSHVVIDEVHERSKDTDFILILLRDVLRIRKDLRVVLMSATLDANVFENYFRVIGPVARVEIEGRTHPVTDYYLPDIRRLTGYTDFNQEEDRSSDQDDGNTYMGNPRRSVRVQIDYDLIAETVQYIDRELGDKEGSILIFLPGLMEIDRTLQALRGMFNIHGLPLHASLLPAEQKRVFPPAPAGLRKVIAATNVAETSITIEDIVAVIDTGRVKETSYDARSQLVKLEEQWASKAACKQRRGRAGRVRAGTCYKLFTRNMEDKMLDRPEPEICRTPLEQLCLSVKAMGIADVPAFLGSALTPPNSLAVESAMERLRRVGALDGEELTALGSHLNMIGADLHCAKLLVYGATFGCLEASLTIASVLSNRSPFFPPRDRSQLDEARAIKATFGQGNGDLIAELRAFEQWTALRNKGLGRRELLRWCEPSFLSLNSLHDINSTRSDLLSTLKEIGLVPLDYRSGSPSANTSPQNAHNSNTALLRALIAGAFNPQLARIAFPEKRFAPSIAGAVQLDHESRMIKYFNQENGRVFLHASSTLFTAQSFPGNATFMSYFSKLATNNKVNMRGATPFNAFSLLMFGGKIGVDPLGRGLLIDDWATLRGWSRIGALASRLRDALDQVLQRKIEEPALDVSGHEVVAVVRKLVELDGLDS